MTNKYTKSPNLHLLLIITVSHTYCVLGILQGSSSMWTHLIPIRSLGHVYVITHFQVRYLGHLPKFTQLGNGRVVLCAITQLYHEKILVHTPRWQMTSGTQVQVIIRKVGTRCQKVLCHLTFWTTTQCCQIVPKPRDPDLCGIADVSMLATNFLKKKFKASCEPTLPEPSKQIYLQTCHSPPACWLTTSGWEATRSIQKYQCGSQ